MNDIAKNQDKVDDGKKVVSIIGLDECEAYSFEIGNGENMPKRKLVLKITNIKGERYGTVCLIRF